MLKRKSTYSVVTLYTSRDDVKRQKKNTGKKENECGIGKMVTLANEFVEKTS